MSRWHAIWARFAAWLRPVSSAGSVDPLVALMTVMAENQRLTMANHEKQLALFAEWLQLFKQPSGQPEDQRPNRDEEEIRDMLELSAEMGNPEAADILADEKRLSAYIRYSRASQ